MPGISAANAVSFEQPPMVAPEFEPNLGHEVAVPAPQVGLGERTLSFARNAIEFTKNHPKIAATLATGATALGIAAPASANTIIDKPAPTITTTTTYEINGVKRSDSDMSKVTVGVYFAEKGISKAQQKRIIAAGGYCFKRKAGQKFINSHRGPKGEVVPYEDKITKLMVARGQNKFCRTVNGKEYKVNCKNPTWARAPKALVPRLVQGEVITLRSWDKAKVTISADSHATVDAGCQTSPGNYATAHGEGKGHASVTMSWRSSLTARGRNIIIKKQGNAVAQAISQSNSSAEASCYSNNVTVTTPGETPCPPGSTKPECVVPPPNPGNRPPTGTMNPVDHMYEYGKHPICVDNISDPDGDPVRVTNFVFRDVNNMPVGQWDDRLIYTQPDGDQCVDYTAGGPGQVTASARLSDGRGGYTTVSAPFPVLQLNDPSPSGRSIPMGRPLAKPLT